MPNRRKKQFVTNARDIRKFKKKKLVTNTNTRNQHVGKRLNVPCPPGTYPCGYIYGGDGEQGPGYPTMNCCEYKPAGQRFNNI